MAEVTNRTMEQLLRIHASQGSWASKLPLVAMMINSTPQSRTRRTPHQVMYGRQPRMPMDVAIAPASNPAAEDYATHLRQLWEEVRQRMTTVAAKDKEQADRTRRTAGIIAGDRVLLSTKNLHLKSKPGKLQPLYVGPFEVTRLVGRNAAKLRLPPAMTTHPVYNVSLLKKYQGEKLLPELVELDETVEYVVEALLKHRGRTGHR